MQNSKFRYSCFKKQLYQSIKNSYIHSRHPCLSLRGLYFALWHFGVCFTPSLDPLVYFLYCKMLTALYLVLISSFIKSPHALVIFIWSLYASSLSFLAKSWNVSSNAPNGILMQNSPSSWVALSFLLYFANNSGIYSISVPCYSWTK